MAVYTDVTEEDLCALLAAYDVGTLLSYKGIAEGVENSNYLLRTSADTFILTLYEKRVNPDDLPFFLGLMDHLAANGLTCPQPIRRRDGAALSTLAGRPAALISFLDGAWPRKPTAAHCREVGRALARMHLAGEGFALHRENALSVEGWRPLWNQASDRADEVEPGLGAEIEAELTRLEAAWPAPPSGDASADALPAGIIHADLFPDNVFFIGERLSGLIDFYFACNDLLAYDLGIALNAWCFEADGAFNLTKGMALLDGYQSRRPLTPAESDVLPLLARGAALRFLLTRLYDWLATPPGALVVKKDPLEYLRKLRFHQGVQNASGYGLRPAAKSRQAQGTSSS
ncbi:homoserine kinase [Pseudohoeflea coraliihabitans]|uniref:Homoserine kinase n=1 Tax=Pseudohoeflea coraliihabitans TaxID=2860393 RepID=A0ABS6WPD1_9HYPH|nr:homoserine kinase [Pseudohoeflea sp. DP4N28-3]MBW3096929.1 homoserine kinase [Pseudohoeflea sp. DP4N28-3]